MYGSLELMITGERNLTMKRSEPGYALVSYASELIITVDTVLRVSSESVMYKCPPHRFSNSRDA
jgi:hypothetical protein